MRIYGLENILLSSEGEKIITPGHLGAHHCENLKGIEISTKAVSSFGPYSARRSNSQSLLFHSSRFQSCHERDKWIQLQLFPRSPPWYRGVGMNVYHIIGQAVSGRQMHPQSNQHCLFSEKSLRLHNRHQEISNLPFRWPLGPDQLSKAGRKWDFPMITNIMSFLSSQ